MTDHMNKNRDQYEILIVDDTQDSLEFLNRILEEQGYRVRLTTNGHLALKSVAAKLPDLILLDVKMPEMDGYEVCRRLKSNEQSRNVPVVFISAHGETAKKVEGFKAGGVDFITKPFEREEVLVRVESQLRLRKLNENLEHEVDKRTAELTLANQQLRQQIAQRERAEEELSREVEVNLAAAELSRKLLSPASLHEISYSVLEHAKNLTGSAYGYVGYIDPETGYLVCPTLTRDIWDTCRVPDKDIVFKEFTGLWGWVLKNRKPLLTNTPIDDSRSSGTPPGHVPVHRFLSSPALNGEKLVGQVSVVNAERDYTHREQQVIERLANLYAIAIQRMQNEEELKKHRHQLEKLVAERTEELEAFAYSVSHDLRAPLRHINGFVDLLENESGMEFTDKGRHYMDSISSVTNNMGELIDDLLSFSRMGRQEMSFTRTDLNEVVHGIVREIESGLSGRNIVWRIDELPVVNCDISMMRVLLMNLVSNAVKFTGQQSDAEIEIGSSEQESEVIIFVRDNGVGFDPAYADKLFGVFSRLHLNDEFEGTGVGLAIVRRIIYRHGGRVWAEGEPDKGAKFSFTLPLVNEGGR